MKIFLILVVFLLILLLILGIILFILMQRSQLQSKGQEFDYREQSLKILAHDIMSPLTVLDECSDHLNDLLKNRQYDELERILQLYTQKISDVKDLAAFILSMDHIKSLIDIKEIKIEDIQHNLIHQLQMYQIDGLELNVTVAFAHQIKVDLCVYSKWSAILRNIVSNVVKHSKSRQIDVTFSDMKGQKLQLEIEIYDKEANITQLENVYINNHETIYHGHKGLGTLIIKRMLSELNAKMTFEPFSEGVCIHIKQQHPLTNLLQISKWETTN